METTASSTGQKQESSDRRPLASTAAGKILEGQRLKNEATALLKQAKLRTADSRQATLLFKRCFAYTRGLVPQWSELVQYAVATGQQDTVMIDPDQEASVRALELACNEGLATIYLRSGHLEKALSYSEKVLLVEPENVKGLFRTGQLHLRMKNIEAAKRCLTRAAKHEPQNVAIRSELRNLSRLAQEYGGGEISVDVPCLGQEVGYDRRRPTIGTDKRGGVEGQP